jgi:hypothetical protein
MITKLKMMKALVKVLKEKDIDYIIILMLILYLIMHLLEACL